MSAGLIRGAGGGGKSGGGKSRTPVESPDSLRSRQYARVIDLVSEGEIEGLVSGFQSVYLDETPVQNSDGTFNFSGVSLVTRNGTQSQAVIDGFPQVEAENSVSAEVVYGLPIVRSISNSNVSAARVTVSVPQLTYQNPSNGDLSGTSVAISVEIQSNGGGYVAAKLRQIDAALSVNGAYAQSTGQIVHVNLSVAWVGDTNVTYSRWGQLGNAYQTFAWQVNYRLIGAPAWSVMASGSFSGSAYWGETYTTDSEGNQVSSGQTVIPPAESRSVGMDLVSGLYEFQVVKVSGRGAASFSSGSASQWSGSDTISGKTTSRYQRAYRFPLEGSAPWDIRVTRLSADSSTANLQNRTYFDSYTEIIDAKLTYPNSALMALSIDSEQFDSIPTRGYEIKGLKVRVPTNYDPLTRIYTGVWDGTFKIAWSDNPAWCFYDLLTNERYGLGAYLSEDQVDKWTLYQIGQYCDELVQNGFGGQEPRFTCNLYLQTRAEAFKVITSMASIFRAMVFWSAGAITAHQDAPSDPVALFTPANVVDGHFTYSGSSVKTRHTVALVAWNDPKDRYRQKIEYVEDPEGLIKYGVQQTELVAVGCASRGQAHRLGRWLLYTERKETETVSFKTGLDGLSITPGEVFQTSDPVRAGVRFGGRIISATASSVEIDSPVSIESGKSYTLWVVLPDGAVQSRAVTTGAGSQTVLSVSPDYDAAPQDLAIWVLAASDLAPELWRAVSIGESDGINAEISALAYHPEKYPEVEQDLILEPVPTSSLTAKPQSVTDIVISESLYLVTNSVVGTRITVSWKSSAVRFEVSYRKAGGNWATISTTTSSVDIQPADPGVYDFKITAINGVGLRSVTETSATVYGLTAKPANVSNLALAAIGGMAHLSFDPATDLDVIVSGYLAVRHTTDTVAPDWSSAIDIGQQIPGASTTATLPLLAGVYLAKWVDSTGNQSAAATAIITDAPNVLAMNYVASMVENPAFSGQKSSVALIAGGIVLDSAETVGEQTGLISTWPRLSALGGISPSGEYLFSAPIDLGSVQTARLTAALKSAGFDALDKIGERGAVSLWPSVVGGLVDDTWCVLYFRSTLDNPSGSPVWGPWQLFVVGDSTARAWQFKAVLGSGYSSHNILVSELQVTVDMPDRTESGDDLASGAGSYHVTYSRPFMVSPAVGITAQNMATGDYYQITSKNASGFDIVFRNAAGTAVSRTFDHISRAY